MGIRFSKSIKIGKYLKINISKSGISATVGKKGASINIGGKGTYVNVSPTAVGLSGTGLSYRQKITGGYKQLLGKIFAGDKEEASTGKKEETVVTDADLTAVEEYEKNFVANVFPYRFIDNVLTKKEFDAKISNAKSSAAKMVYQLTIDGDEDTIETLVGSFFANLDLKYNVKANYELEDHELYVDLDLPEIDDIQDTYPCLVKKEIINKRI